MKLSIYPFLACFQATLISPVLTEANTASIQSTPTIVLEESFENLDNWSDMSTAISWTGQPQNLTAWDTSSGVLTLSDAGVASVGLEPWTGKVVIAESRTNDGTIIRKTTDNISSRSMTAIDYQFSQPISHREGHLVIEFRARWDSMIYDLSGEWNRINLMLVHDYPEEGLDLTLDDKMFDFTKEWWGRPSYQVRIRGNDSADGNQSGAMLMYGGGASNEGEFEIYYNTGGDPLYWLAGFSSTAGGSSSQGGPSPGVGYPWPFNGWVESSRALASLDWQKFRYVVSPYSSALYIDSDDDSKGWVREGWLPLPEVADAPATAPAYNYFENHEGLRIYFRGYENAQMDDLRIWYYPDSVIGDIKIIVNQGIPTAQFHTEVGKSYQMEISNNLTDWIPKGELTEGNGFHNSINLTPWITSDPLFVRVRQYQSSL